MTFPAWFQVVFSVFVTLLLAAPVAAAWACVQGFRTFREEDEIERAAREGRR